ncbi:hypothetical protein ONR57_10940 [Hoyosella sp. YIM 151337]|uniref:hypothetical protein n=1 Tax=Hoyosella sp. YIM 151337 TaxID=2992742 RepID=UPI002236622A|nr:hypothetical protein [Hoyosella sp. YIM 151337]MCW4353813.1 hypothetical protein [Hoyosella sp. YIM 151337]
MPTVKSETASGSQQRCRTRVLRVTWRQHRTLIAVVVVVMLAAAVTLTVLEQLYAHSPGPVGSGREPWWVRITGLALQAAQLGAGLLPLLLGAFVGAGVVARESEHGTTTLAFTQSVPRRKWCGAKIVVVFIPVTAASVLLALAAREQPAYVGAREGRFAFEHFTTTPLIASLTTFTALLAGATIALWVRSQLAASAVTMIVLLVFGTAIASYLRPHYAAPSVHVMSVEAAVRDGQYPLGDADRGTHDAWTLSYDYVTAEGRALPSLWAACPWHGDWPMPPEPRAGEPSAQFATRQAEYEELHRITQNDYHEYLAACFRGHGADRYEIRYHANSQFWRFQLTEAGLLVLVITGLLAPMRTGLRRLT